MCFSCDCCVLSAKVVYDGPVTHPGEPYRVCVCVCVCVCVTGVPVTHGAYSE